MAIRFATRFVAAIAQAACAGAAARRIATVVAVAAAAALAAPAPARAHAEHGQPVHGGIVAEAGTFQGELVARPAGLTLYVTDHGKPIPTQGASARIVVLAGGQKTEAALSPAGDNRLEAAQPVPMAAGAKAVASVKLADGRAGALRFEMR